MNNSSPKDAQRVRRVCWTLNNPTEAEIVWLKSDEHTTLVRHSCFAKEVAPSTGTEHLQGHSLFNKQILFSKLKKYLGYARMHIEIMRGTSYFVTPYLLQVNLNSPGLTAVRLVQTIGGSLVNSLNKENLKISRSSLERFEMEKLFERSYGPTRIWMSHSYAITEGSKHSAPSSLLQETMLRRFGGSMAPQVLGSLG